MNKVKVLSLFSGIGAFEKALQNLGMEFDLVNYCEIDKYASKSYSLIHNVSEDKNLVDVTKINTELLPKDLDLVTYGFPCVPKGYMIKVENGYKAIEDITDSDLVLTHTNTYKKVVKTMSRVSDHINHIKLVGCQDLQLTDEHPLYVLRNGEFTWVKAKDLNTETDYLCYNINNKAIPCEYSDVVLWLMGRYFAGDYEITNDYVREIFSSSTTKEIPQWIVDLPKQQLEMFYKGYFSGDDSNKNMSLALQDIFIKLYNVVPTNNMEHDASRPKDQIVKDNKVCVKIKDVIRELKDIEVFNFEVEEDNSYTVNNVIVHNCQDISQAGKQRGFADENGERTRSGLFFEALRVIEDTKPKYAIAENVKALTSKKFEKEFKIVLDSLDDAGYNNYYQILNAKDYGIPQNRERIFIVSIRKDIDNGEFVFPEKEILKLRLKDLLQPEVEEKYYLKESKAYFMKHSFEEELKGNGFRFSPHIKDNADISKAITTRAGDRMDDNFILDNKIDTDDTNFVFSSKNINLINDDTEAKCVRVGGIWDTETVRHQAGGIYDPNGISSTLDTMQGGSRTPYIITHNIKQQVVVRKHDVDTDRLKTVLKDSKNLSGLSCNDIAQKLDVPLTNVEHWFRSDNCFSIPSADIWFKLKELLNIKDDSFDKSITEFEVVDDKFDMADRVYDSQGISPTLTAAGEHKIVDNSASVELLGSTNGHQSGNYYNTGGVSPCICATHYKSPTMIVEPLVCEDRTDEGLRFYKGNVCGTLTTKDSGGDKRILEPLICASRGRNPEDPSDRTVGAPTEQRLEINTQGISNTLTTVQKDNYVLEPQIIRDEPLHIDGWHRNATEVLNSSGLCRTLSTQSNNLCTKVTDPINYRIRKLTPTECWRLMGFTDEDINKCIAGGLSNAQLYKQAGNSIVVQVLERLLELLFNKNNVVESQKLSQGFLF